MDELENSKRPLMTVIIWGFLIKICIFAEINLKNKIQKEEIQIIVKLMKL